MKIRNDPNDGPVALRRFDLAFRLIIMAVIIVIGAIVVRHITDAMEQAAGIPAPVAYATR